MKPEQPALPPRPTYAELEADLRRREWKADRQSGGHLTYKSQDGRIFPVPVQHRSRTATHRVLAGYKRTVVRGET